MNAYEAKKMIRRAYWKILDASETLDHWDSVISVKIIRPIKSMFQRS